MQKNKNLMQNTFSFMFLPCQHVPPQLNTSLHYAYNNGRIHINIQTSPTQIFIMPKYEGLFEADEMMKVFIHHSLPPGQGGDVGPDLSVNFPGHHAEDAEVPH